MHALVIRKQIEYLAPARRQQHAAENPTFEEDVQRKQKNNPAPNPRTPQAGMKATWTSFGSLGAGSRNARTGVERCSGGHGRCVIMPQRARTVFCISNLIIRTKGEEP